MYHHLPPQIKGSMEKEQVLLANNLFVASYSSCIFHSVVCFQCNFVCNFSSHKWQLVWQLVLDGWFGWLQVLAFAAFGVLTFAAGNSKHVFFSLISAHMY